MNVKAIRKQRGLTIKALANSTGLHIDTIIKYESGKRTATEKNIVKIKKALNCTYEELLEENLKKF